MSINFNYHYPKYKTQNLSNKGNFYSNNYINRFYNANTNDTWKLSNNNLDVVFNKPKTTIIPKNKTNIYNSYNQYISPNNTNFSSLYKKQNNPRDCNSINNYNYNLNNNYDLLPKVSNKKMLSNSVFTANDNFKDSYNYSQKKNYINDNNINYNSSTVDSIVSSKVGLQNLGNTCFMNTCLQCLIHSEYFIQKLLDTSLESFRNPKITNEFLKLCKKMGSGQGGSYAPSDFKNIFGYHHSLFRGYGQNDTQEFCRVLLEDMNKELNRVKGKPSYIELKTSNKPKRECDEEYDYIFKRRESSIIIDSFYGQLINIFTCKCNFKDYSFQKILDLPLLFEGNTSYFTIYELLDKYFKDEVIQFEAKCENCGRKTMHKKELKISRPPNILILSLQRINGRRSYQKNNSPVDFPEKLNIKKYIDEECGHGDEYNYTLYAIGNHSGTINFGHYYAFIKLNNKDWYEFNDSRVSKRGTINTRSDSVYTLFYKKNL